MSPLLIASSLLLSFLLGFLLIPNRRRGNQPPSPPKLPIIGNLHQLGTLPHRSLRALAQKHGSLMLLHLGSSPTLVASSEESAREIMKTHDLSFADRPTSIVTDLLLHKGKDIAFAPYGEYWRQVKKICVLQLLSAKRVDSFASMREEEVGQMMEKISQAASGPVDLGELLLSTTNNIVSRAVLGRKHYEERRGSGKGLKELMAEVVDLAGTPHIGDIIPFLAWIGWLSGLDARLKRNFREWDRFLDQVIEEHLSSEDGGEGSVQDFVGVLLDVLKKGQMTVPFGKENIKAIVLDIFVAGTDSSYSTMEWTMAELITHPSVMKKVQEEARQLAQGRSRIREDELHKLQYLKLVIKESLRLHPPNPLLLPREAIKDVQVQGYQIPAKARVIVNAWAIGRDPKSWEDAEEFRPERFDNSSVDFRGQHYQFLPFGAGRRGCPGILFALPSIELVLANLLNKFDWELPGGADVQSLDMEESFGIGVHRKSPLIVVAKPRI